MTEKDRTLKSFGKCSVALVDLLGKGERLDIVEQALIENHLLIIQMAYRAWKHRDDRTQT